MISARHRTVQMAGGLFGAWGAWAVEVGVKVLEIYFGYGLGQQLYSLASGFDAHDGHQLSSAEYWGSWGGLLGSIAGGYASGKAKLAARGKAMGEFVAGERCAWQLSRACFAAGTMLLTPDGSVAIESLKVGDVVVSRNEYDANGPLTERRVLQTFERVAPVVNLHVQGEIIGTTESHPFWVVGQGWTAAGGLRIGDELAGHDGMTVKVEGVAPSGMLVPVYNVEVEDDHTYFVVGEGWSLWAHNATYDELKAEAASKREQAKNETPYRKAQLEEEAKVLEAKAEAMRSPENTGQPGETVTRFDSAKKIKDAKKNGIPYNPEKGNGTPTTKGIDPVNPDVIKQKTGARSAEEFINIDISGLPVLRRRTKAGAVEVVVQADIIPASITSWGRVLKSKFSR